MTPSPAPVLITVNPGEDPAGFLKVLPASERLCLEQAVGLEQLEEFIARNDPREEFLQECVGEDTIRRVTLGQMAGEAGGLSDGTATCLLEETESLDFRKLVFEDEIGPEFRELFQAYAFCLSDEELLRSWGDTSGNPMLTATQLRCIVSSTPEAIFMIGRPIPEFAELYEECGIPTHLIGEPAEPPLISAEQEACLIDALGESAMREVFSGQRSPIPEEIEAFAGCGVESSDMATRPPEMEFPDFESLPEIAAPLEISTVVWPSSDADAFTLLERLPDEISGQSLMDRLGGPGASRSEFTYGENPETREPVLSASVHYLTRGDF